jgi:hypothetical protein
MQDNSPWNGAREVLRIYPFLEGIWGTTSPELYLDSEGYACKQGTARVFHGNEEKWSEHNWKNLLRSLERVVTLCQRRGQEARVLINLVHRVRGTSELPPTDQDPLTEAQQLLKCIRLGRSPVIPEPFSPETLERLEGERRERQARKSREAVEWSRNFDQTLKELEITIPQEQERRDQIFRANLGSNEAISRCLDEAGRIMAPYAKPVPPEEG